MFERRGLCVYVFTHINVSSKLRICINRFNLTLLLTGGNKRLPLELQLFLCSKQCYPFNRPNPPSFLRSYITLSSSFLQSPLDPAHLVNRRSCPLQTRDKSFPTSSSPAHSHSASLSSSSSQCASIQSVALCSSLPPPRLRHLPRC